LDRVEVDLLADAAVGAGPVVGHVGPRRAGRETLARMAFRLVEDVAAAGTAEGAHEAAPAVAPPPAKPSPDAPPPWRARSFARLRGWMFAWVRSPSKWSTRRGSITR